MPESHEAIHDRTPTYWSSNNGALAALSRALRTWDYVVLATLGRAKGMIIKQFAALAVLALALSGCATSLNNASAGGATTAVVTRPHWCREHRFYRYDLAWKLHHCGFWL
jgi:hypothetical protein